jgi:hypothetical protein
VIALRLRQANQTPPGLRRSAVALPEPRDGISRREPFVRPEKRRCAVTLSRGRGGQGSSNIAAINDQQSGSSSAGCDLRSDRREAPRSAPFFVNLTV